MCPIRPIRPIRPIQQQVAIRDLRGHQLYPQHLRWVQLTQRQATGREVSLKWDEWDEWDECDKRNWSMNHLRLFD